MKTKKKDVVMQDKVFQWIALGTGAVLLIPLIAQWPWTLGDFILMGVLLFGAGSTFVFLVRKLPKHRLTIGIVVLAALLYIWAELAVGIFTNLGS
jgi:hypothetical protein